jgi:hypothetical protein
MAHAGFEYVKGCFGKRGYPSKRIAEGVLRTLNDPELNVYACKSCKRHHIGHK